MPCGDIWGKQQSVYIRCLHTLHCWLLLCNSGESADFPTVTNVLLHVHFAAIMGDSSDCACVYRCLSIRKASSLSLVACLSAMNSRLQGLQNPTDVCTAGYYCPQGSMVRTHLARHSGTLTCHSDMWLDPLPSVPVSESPDQD